MASEIRVNRLSNRSGLSTITFANGGVQFSGITTFANGDFRVGTGATILNPSTNEMQFHTGGSNRLTINNEGINLGIGSITVGDATFTGSVSIGKTLTYEDVKNVDSVGVVTARTGVKITGGDFTVGTAITASSVTGNVTNDVGITTYSGSAVWFKGATANKDMYWSHASGATVYKDNAQILMGDSSDMQISHDGSNSYIKDTGTGFLSVQGSEVHIRGSNDENGIKVITNGRVELYHDNVKTFETVSGGSKVTGDLDVTGHIDVGDGVNIKLGADDDLKIWHDGGGHNYIRGTDSTRNYIQHGTHNAIITYPSSSVELYFNNSKKLETRSGGVTVTGGINLSGELLNNDFIQIQADNKHLIIGAGDDLRAYHNGTDSVVNNNTGTLFVQSDDITFKDKDNGDVHAKFIHDGAVELYHNNAKTFETTSGGATVTGSSLNVINPASAGDSRLYIKAGQNGTSYILFNADEGDNDTDKWRLLAPNGGPFALQYSDGSWENSITATNNGAVNLYHNDSKKFETTSSGAKVTGNLEVTGVLTYDDVTNIDSVGIVTARAGVKIPDGQNLTLGSDGDIGMKHQSGHFEITNNTGNTYFNANGQLVLRNNQGGSVKELINGWVGVDLKYDNSTKLSTTSSGATVTGDITISDKIIHAGDTNTAIRFPAADTITAETGGSERLRITSAGKVGIGTEIPSELLEIASSASCGIAIKDDNNGFAASKIKVENGGRDLSIGAPQDIFFKDIDTGTKHLYIESTGHIGINQDNPSDRLEINPTANNEGLTIKSTGTIYPAITGNTNRTGSDEFLLNIRGMWNNTTVANILLETGSDTTNKDDGVITFRTASAGSPAERLRIASDGKIGINVTSPSTNLQIGGATVDSDNVITLGKRVSCSESNLPKIGHHSDNAGSSSLALCATSSSGKIHFFTGNGGNGFGASSNAERMVITSGGNVGIGTDAGYGDAKLTVEGTAALTNNDTTLQIKDNVNDSAAGRGGNIGFSAYVNGTQRTFAAIGGLKSASGTGNFSGDLALYTRVNGQSELDERLRIASDGKIGINASNPNSLLEVRATGGTYTNAFTVFTGNTTHSGSNSKNGIGLYSYGDALRGGLSSNLLYSNSSTPSQSYASRSSGQIEITNTTSSNATSEITFGGYYKGTTSFVERLRITSAGRVGIGTVTPVSTLHVTSDANNLFTLQSTDRYSTAYLVDTIGSSYIQNDSGNLRFGTGGGANAAGGETEAVRIDSSGRLIQRYSAAPYDNRAATFQSPAGQAQTFIAVVNTETNGASGILFGDHAGQNAGNYDGYIQYSHQYQHMAFMVASGTERLRIASSGMNSSVNLGFGQAPHGDYFIDILNNDSAHGMRLRSTGSTYHDIVFDANRSSGEQALGRIVGKWNGNAVAYLQVQSGNDASTKQSGRIKFFTANEGGPLERMEILPTGAVHIGTTNEIQLTASNHEMLHLHGAVTDANADHAWGINIDMDDDNAGTATADRERGCIHLDFHGNNYGGGTSHELRLWNIHQDIEINGDYDDCRGVYTDMLHSATTGQTTNCWSGYFQVQKNNAGQLNNMYGLYGLVQNTTGSSGTINDMVGVRGRVNMSAGSGGGKATDVIGVWGNIDNDNNVTQPSGGKCALFYGSYDKTTGLASPHGVYIATDVPNYFKGKVGINQSSPSQTLHIRGHSGSNLPVYWIREGSSVGGYLYSDGGGSGIVGGDGVLDNTGIYLMSDTRIDFRVNGSERLRINSSGYVGVKRSTPLANLHTTNNELSLGANPTSAAAPNATYDGLVVDGEAASFINIRSRGDGNNSYGRLAFSDDVRSRAYVEYRHKDGGGDDTMRFATAGAERLRIHSNGVSINTTTNYDDVDLYVNDFVRLGNFFIGRVPGTSNNSTGVVLIGRPGLNFGIHFSGQITFNSYTGTGTRILDITTTYNDNSDPFAAGASGELYSSGNVSRVNLKVCIGTVDGSVTESGNDETWLCLRKNGGGTGTAQLNAFIQTNAYSHGGIREIASGKFTQTQSIADFN